MLERISGWIKSAAPTLIFIFAILVGMKMGSWAMYAIIIFAIALYGHWAVEANNDEKVRQQFALLIIFAAVMAYGSLKSHERLRKIEDICEETSREDEDQCSRILWEIQDGGRSDDYDQ